MYAIKIHIAIFLCLLMGISHLDVTAQNSHANDFTELNQTLIRNFANDFEFSVLVESHDTVLFSGHYGYINKKKTRPVDSKTLFNIASITKSITSIGIMKLVEQHKINLTDQLNVFFGDVPESMQSITVRTLLSHKSGFKQTYPLTAISASDAALDAIFAQTLEFPPGTGFRYSNQNYQLLALIIEQTTETTFEDYIRTNVLSPLLMEDTYFWDEVKAEDNIAPLIRSIARRIGKRNWGFIGSTGIFTTTSDLSKFWKGIYKNGFVSKASLDTIFRPYYETSSGIQIGFGFFISPNAEWKTTELWTRGTESWGHNSVIRYFPEKQILIIVSTNSGEIENDSAKTGNRLISDLIAGYVLR
ncbi:MAG: beta-lactamase family protein [Bacteroidia bacterium]|nr:beta-lactamase family protein [Bacteroidia bacterium]